jgi:two-component system, LytTR family, sensor kinase
MKLKNIRTFLINLLIIELAGLIITFLINQNVQIIREYFFYILAFSANIGLLLWYGNTWIVVRIRQMKQLAHKPGKAFVVSASGTFIYSILVIYLIDFLWNIFYFGREIKEYQIPPLAYLISVMAITLIISFAMYIKGFIEEKKKAIIREERLQTEIIKLEYETLKNQVNPHFLFNSLNALTSLVAENEEAVRFIKKLSDVYRYVLGQKDREIVEIGKEIQFVSAYLYLHQIRFGKALEIDMEVMPKHKMVVPLSVQMLVENAVKHNEISEDERFRISIFVHADYLVVENKLLPKSIPDGSAKTGLENIRSRYAYLTDRPVITEKTEGKFVVKIPLLEPPKR